MKKLLVVLSFAFSLSTPLFAMEPFGSDLKVPAKTIKASTPAPPQSLTILDPADAASWSVEFPTPNMDGAYRFVKEDGKEILKISTGKFTPAMTTLRRNLPADQSGAVWTKNKASYISLLCKSDRPVTMSLHLLQRGKTPGTFKAGFSVKPGDWQRVLLPAVQFDLRSFSQISGIAFRLVSPTPDANVSISDIKVGGTPYSDDTWKSHRLSIPLKGDWYFATDSNDQGVANKWFSGSFDDSNWKVLRAGASWEEQGITHSGWGWYRQKILIPREFAGTPLYLSLGDIPSDDDTWFNGTRIGGFSGGYKYATQQKRVYVVPPAMIKYGELNTIAMRVWGGNLEFNINKSGLKSGIYSADLDPYRAMMRSASTPETLAENFDLSDAQRGAPFEIVFRFPDDVAKEAGATLQYDLADFGGQSITSGSTPLVIGDDGIARGVVKIDSTASQTVYLRGRIKAGLTVFDAQQNPLYSGTQEIERLSFTKRDTESLPALAATIEDTPFGKLKLVDEIDCSRSISDDPHPYLQSGFTPEQKFEMPGSNVNVEVREILGKKARESDYGWFAYRIGRGTLKPHSTYLVRIEYPEDKPRYAPIEFQTGQNFMDVGWKNGLTPDDPYDPWPLSNKWQWYDTIVPLDDETTGTGGTNSGAAQNGFWIYFMNKQKPGLYNALYSGGPAVSRIKLYEIDVEKNAPVINKPQGAPSRVLMMDWERQPDSDPADFVRYAKLMGYNAISPVILKWGNANYGEPLNGYDSTNTDAHNYWVRDRYDPKTKPNVGAAVPGKETIHARYLAATKKYGVNYVPRFEYGGSMDLPEAAKAISSNGQLAKPNRFAEWGANLLHPATWDDLQKLMDVLIKPYAKDNPQMTGALWRIRSDRMQISYGRADLELFSKETNTPLPAGGYEQMAAWASGEMKTKYDGWWHQKRADFHKKLVALLKSYRPDLTLYYYNWDADKFSLIEPDMNAAAFFAEIVKPVTGGRAAYERDRAVRKSFTSEDYISVMHSGNWGKASKGINRADYALRPELYKDMKGIELFAPVDYFDYANKPEYLNYFKTADGLAVSNVVSYDEIASRYINPKYEGNMITPAGPNFSMALEVLSYFYGDARTLTYTAYTYGRGFADAHRRFAQAFLALPATEGKVIENADKDVKVREYSTPNGDYIGVAYKGFSDKKITVKIPGAKAGATVKDLVTNATVASTRVGDTLQFEIASGPMELHSYLIQ
jgi:hypothetical protein